MSDIREMYDVTISTGETVDGELRVQIDLGESVIVQMSPVQAREFAKALLDITARYVQ